VTDGPGVTLGGFLTLRSGETPPAARKDPAGNPGPARGLGRCIEDPPRVNNRLKESGARLEGPCARRFPFAPQQTEL
jgi:hypothetical protein